MWNRNRPRLEMDSVITGFAWWLLQTATSRVETSRHSTALLGGDGEDKANNFPLSENVWMNDSTAISVIRWLLNGSSQLLSMAWWKELMLTVINCFLRHWDFMTREGFFWGQKTLYQLNIVLHYMHWRHPMICWAFKQLVAYLFASPQWCGSPLLTECTGYNTDQFAHHLSSLIHPVTFISVIHYRPHVIYLQVLRVP